MKRISKYILLFFTCQLSLSIFAQRTELSLDGWWDTELGVIKLPGTTDENHLGDRKHPTDVTTQLTRLYPYTGELLYERVVNISKEMAQKKLSLYMERTKPSTLFVDGVKIGSITQLYAPHVYQLPRLLPGKHRIQIGINNRDDVVPQNVRGSHAWTDATQTNWNGILGKFCIIGTDGTYINKMNVYPDADKKTACVKVQVIADKNMTAKLKYTCLTTEEKKVNLEQGTNEITYLIQLGDDVRLWSEFHPNLYTVKVELEGKKCADSREVRFGVRKFATEGTQFTINGKKTFLRGTHDACVFPINAYSPTNVDEWRTLFKKAKEYGINHYRFHSYTPTEAAFEAADEVGMYLQTELPLWGTINSSTVDQNKFLLNEAHTAIDFLGNHASFMALGLGNELWGDFKIMKEWLDSFRKQDDRHLYVFGSNNTLGWQGVHDGEDYFVTCRVGGGEHYKTNTRTSFSFADEDDGGILNHVRPNTRDDFSYPVSICPRPIVAHETCQFQMYPDYDQIDHYRGVLYPYNLEIFRDRLEENGLTEQAKDFTKSTTEWGLECYKADIEYCVRTPGFGGYQLLDLKDYPGQGSALCGILDAFMNQKSDKDKKVINVMQPVVPMMLMEKYCWSAEEPFEVDFKLANYTEEDWNQPLTVTIHADGKETTHSFDIPTVKQGDVAPVARFAGNSIREYIDCGDKPFKATFTLKTGDYSNEYNIWVYPDKKTKANKNILICDSLDGNMLKALILGKTVILNPRFSSIEKQSIGGLFTPDYWNYAMFKTISENNNKPVSPGSLGMLMNPEHPLFEGFPTDDHTDWQWWCVAKNSRPLILNNLPKDYLPIIQTVDNVERNHKLGILMEFKFGKGKILICTTDIASIGDCVEGRAFREAIMNYVTSADFNPTTEITYGKLYELLYIEPTTVRDIQGVKNQTDYKNDK